MKILILSDTHNNINLFKRVLEENKSDVLFHLGDNYEDSDKADFSKYCPTLYRVPGVYHPGYRDGSLPYLETVNLFNFKIKLVHSIDDVNFDQVSDSIIFYGHTHIHNVQEYKSNILINPGHLKRAEDRNQLASYLLMYASDSELLIEWQQVEKGLIKTYKIIKNKDNKLELKI
jgi:predicted phosphodiesterase